MKEKKILIVLLILIFILNYHFLDSMVVSAFSNSDSGQVGRVIDGDTLVLDGEHVRLLGINAPEKGEKYYKEAKEYLEQINGSKVVLKYNSEKTDRYGRILAYVFYQGRNINLELVENGFANPYFPSGQDEYYDEFFQAWQNCLHSGTNLCVSSQEPCLAFSWEPKQDEMIIEEICGEPFNLSGWSIKDEGRKKYTFSNKTLQAYEEKTLTSKNFEKNYVWTRSGDSVFIRNSRDELIYYNHY